MKQLLVFCLFIVALSSCSRATHNEPTDLFNTEEGTKPFMQAQAAAGNHLVVQIESEVPIKKIEVPLYTTPCVDVYSQVNTPTVSTADQDPGRVVTTTCADLPGTWYKGYVWHDNMGGNAQNEIEPNWINLPALLRTDHKKYENFKGTIKEVRLKSGKKGLLLVEDAR